MKIHYRLLFQRANFYVGNPFFETIISLIASRSRQYCLMAGKRQRDWQIVWACACGWEPEGTKCWCTNDCSCFAAEGWCMNRFLQASYRLSFACTFRCPCGWPLKSAVSCPQTSTPQVPALYLSAFSCGRGRERMSPENGHLQLCYTGH